MLRDERTPPALAAYLGGLKARNVTAIGASLAEEVQFVTPVRTMYKPEVLGFLSALYAGFPDWSYERDEPQRLPDGAYAVRWRQGGVHTGILALPESEPVPPTGRRVVIPEQRFLYRVGPRGLIEIRPDPIPGGAPGGIFEQIGLERPPL